MEQASGSIMTGKRGFFAHLLLSSLTSSLHLFISSLLLFYSITVVALDCFSALGLLYTIYYSYSLSGEHRCLVLSGACRRYLLIG